MNLDADAAYQALAARDARFGGRLFVGVYGLKAIVGRARPALWGSQWYWGSSFPSGNTLSTAAFATAAALCLGVFIPLLFSGAFDGCSPSERL